MENIIRRNGYAYGRSQEEAEQHFATRYLMWYDFTHGDTQRIERKS